MKMYFYTGLFYAHIINEMTIFQVPLEGVVSFFSAESKPSAELIGSEVSVAASFHPKRLADFATGRHCAREALYRLGFGAIEIPTGADREPLWPEGITGSISHAEGLAGAMAARRGHHFSLGLDIERRGSVTRELWDHLFTKSEQDLLRRHGTERPDLPTIFFSMKESFYKMQFPLTGRFLDFPEVEILVSGAEHRLRLTDGRQLPGLPDHHLLGHVVVEGHVITWSASPAI